MDTKHLIFPFSPDAMMQPKYISATHHVLCHQGSLTFTINNSQHRMVAHDYAIVPNAATMSEVTWSDDYRGDVMILSEWLIRRIRPHNNYHVTGYLALSQNPIMHLSEPDYLTCAEDIALIRRRFGQNPHKDPQTGLKFSESPFYDEMLEHLMMVHVLNLYDIHARQMHSGHLPERASQLVEQFIRLLDEGHYRNNRSLAFYADRLCITPHYLSEVSKKVTGRPASFWIDMYLADETIRLMTTTDRTMTDIAYELNFSSLSYFNRYARKLLGMSPTLFRQRSKERMG